MLRVLTQENERKQPEDHREEETVIKHLAILICFISPCSALAQKPAPPTANAQEPRQATLAQQKMCADQARKFFNEDKEQFKYNNYAEYTSHYDAKVNACYVMIHRFGDRVGGDSLGFDVFDAFEGVERGRLVNVKDHPLRPPLVCAVQPVGKENVFCHSSDEFFDLVKKHFGLERP